MDLATMFGMVVAFGLVTVAIGMGGSFTIFYDVPSLLIVIGGTLGAGFISYPMRTMLGALKIAINAFVQRPQDLQDVIGTLTRLAMIARRDGILALEKTMDEAAIDEFIKKGVQLTVDGQETKAIRTILGTEINSTQERHRQGADLFVQLGTFAPALGLIGTLIGLVQMLQHLSDPSVIGPAMSVALLTTFYGAIMANLLFNPIAGKLRARAEEEYLFKELVLEGIIAITVGDNPRMVEQKLQAFLAPRLRVSSFRSETKKSVEP